MRVRLLHQLLVPVAAGALLLTGCAGEPESKAPNTNVSFKPVPSATAPEPSKPGAGVIQWYQSGGRERLNGLITSARIAHGSHEADKVYIDMGPLSTSLEDAHGYAMIPDPKTHESWTKARKQIGSGLRRVMATSGLGVPSRDVDDMAGVPGDGWSWIADGIETLRDTDAQLRALGCVSTEDPWK
ncbi:MULTISPECIES: hypothetical protein [unclassified Streptomyces]|uniref:hypothetical protein n=1 Tax=unclassified Streptomyces TaxID=2593676 RepID=UPI000DC7DF68|nr:MULTISPECIES: hypothetical protein [unclassified Streptomyces]AWZ09673.1 hypothetical protein DRB89_40510 [Streptomyces sp. ICC4]AWZ17432.1 hypothetical protein DRB96_40990 [Streptomyces sp. ICC1]